MIKYVVTWVLTTYFSVPCVTEPPKPDEYGRVPEFTLSISMACYGSKTDTLKKEFTDRKAAISFIKNGQGDSMVLSNFKLDSIKITKN